MVAQKFQNAVARFQVPDTLVFSTPLDLRALGVTKIRWILLRILFLRCRLF